MTVALMRELAKRQKVSEKQEQAAIVQLLESLGAKVYVIGTRRPKGDFQGTRQTPGIPDLYCLIPKYNPGRFADTVHSLVPLWVEVKRLGGKLRPAQREFQSLCQQAAHHHVTGTCDDVQHWLVDHGWLKESQRRRALMLTGRVL